MVTCTAMKYLSLLRGSWRDWLARWPAATVHGSEETSLPCCCWTSRRREQPLLPKNCEPFSTACVWAKNGNSQPQHRCCVTAVCNRTAARDTDLLCGRSSQSRQAAWSQSGGNAARVAARDEDPVSSFPGTAARIGCGKTRLLTQSRCRVKPNSDSPAFAMRVKSLLKVQIFNEASHRH